MNSRFLLAKPMGADESFGIVLPDFGPSETALQRAAELLSHVHAVPMREQDIELKPFAPANMFLRDTVHSSSV